MSDLTCEVCKTPLLDDSGEGHFAEIRRGYFKEEDDDLEMQRIKCNVFICHKCYLEDPDFCRFMNKIGYNIR